MINLKTSDLRSAEHGSACFQWIVQAIASFEGSRPVRLPALLTLFAKCVLSHWNVGKRCNRSPVERSLLIKRQNKCNKRYCFFASKRVL